MTPKTLDIFVTGFAAGLLTGIILTFSFSSPSSEASRPEESLAGFITAGYSRGLTDVFHMHGIAGSNPAPAINGVRSGLREAPPTHHPSGLHIIHKAAERNGIKYGSDNWFILLAIRKAENGRDGLQFGIMNPKAYNLDKQAGWAAATVVKTRTRWQRQGCPADFISFLQKRYCPDNEGGEAWLKNVRFWFSKFKEK